MIKFFRKIRQKLLSENKFSKYLIYAIGEITLVVFGILIALQVNNWNEQRKSKSQEIKILTEVRNALKVDLKDIKFNIDWHGKAKKSCETIINVFNLNTPYNDSLDVHFGQAYLHTNFLPNLGSYETIKSKGIDLISNDSIRINLALYYEQDIKYALVFESTNESIFPQTYAMYLENFDNWVFLETAKLRNYMELRNNYEFISYLQFTAGLREKEIRMFESLKQKCNELIGSIEAELIKN